MFYEFMSTIETYLYYSLQLAFYMFYHQFLHVYHVINFFFLMNSIIRDYHVIMSMGSVT